MATCPKEEHHGEGNKMSEEGIKNLARICADSNLKLKTAKKLFDALYITDALKQAGGNQTGAARRLGIDRITLNRFGNETMPRLANRTPKSARRSHSAKEEVRAEPPEEPHPQED